MKATLKRAFHEGVGSILSLQGNYFTMPSIPVKNDAEYIRGDWESVGNDLRYVMRQIRE